MREIDEAIIAVKGEREYQEAQWRDSDRSIAKFLLLIESYVDDAKKRQRFTDNLSEAHGILDDLRKIAALAICAMEYNGIAYRKDGGHETENQNTL